ncbi:MAG: hypothetical protein ACE5GT_10740 [Rhodospirillales bacterium]
MAKYEVTIYNAEVREKVQQGEHHTRYTDDWADFRYIEVSADTEAQARRQVRYRYPSEQGFVIDDVQKSEDQKYE